MPFFKSIALCGRGFRGIGEGDAEVAPSRVDLGDEGGDAHVGTAVNADARKTSNKRALGLTEYSTSQT